MTYTVSSGTLNSTIPYHTFTSATTDYQSLTRRPSFIAQSKNIKMGNAMFELLMYLARLF